jgi:hypothetical protein
MWKQLIDPENGRAEYGRGVIYEWLQSPSVYGTYKASFPKLKKLSQSAASLGSEIVVESAFPAFASVDDQHRINLLLSGPDRPKIRGRWPGPRNHALHLVCCNHPMPYGEICGRRLGAMYNADRDGIYRYTSVVCGVRGHRYSLPPQIDDEVLDLVLSVFTSDRLCMELDRIRRDGGAGAVQVERLAEEVSSLVARTEWENRNAFDARRKGKSKAAEFHEAQKERALEELAKKERELERARARSEAVGDISDHEYEQIVALASDLHELIGRARPLVGKVREILRELIGCVHARRLGMYAYHLEVELHSGQRLRRTVIVRHLRAPQPVRALAHGRLAPWLDPASRSTVKGEKEAMEAAEALAAELNSLLEGGSDSAWTADRLFTAALLYSKHENEDRSGPYEDPAELAAKLRLSAGPLLRAALKGTLGPARAHEGTLALCPTAEELHGAFPALARREVAEQAGWPTQDMVTLKQLARETGWNSYRVERVAEQGAGVLCDAAGRCYTRRSEFQIPTEEDLARVLDEAVPEVGDRVNGRWMTWTQAKDRLPGVNIRTFEAHTAVVRPGFGENGLSTSYVWIDPQVEARVRNPTLPEAVVELGLPGVLVQDFHLRTEVLAKLRERFGMPSYHAWRAAVDAGLIIEVRAQGANSRRLQAYALVPRTVMDATSANEIERFLSEAFTPSRYTPTSDQPASSLESGTARGAA